ncbi:MAG: potassium channel family protein, partial [Psychromonas sp.]
IDNSAQMMVRSMQDPGSSKVTEKLLSTLDGATLYSFLVPELEKSIAFGELFDKFKHRYDMILIGFSRHKSGQGMNLNPSSDTIVNSGFYLHYIANERLDENDINWKEIK